MGALEFDGFSWNNGGERGLCDVKAREMAAAVKWRMKGKNENHKETGERATVNRDH